MKTKIITIMITSVLCGISYAADNQCNNLQIDNMRFLTKEGNKCVFYRLSKSAKEKEGRSLIIATITNGKRVDMQGLATVCGSRQIGLGESVPVILDIDHKESAGDYEKFFKDRTALTWKEIKYSSDSSEEKMYRFMCKSEKFD